ncbi:MAG: ABC transporter permease subunit [Oscillospiraceae bacterium]|jgi:putative aldouronate transport system permease protein|nr:ABC transporter permease subunit [Oscillospiraceae bacterium]
MQLQRIKSKRFNWKSAGNRMKRYWVLYLMLLLPLAYLIIFKYMPMQYLAMAFKKNNIIQPLWEVPWANNGGFQWFLEAFKNPSFWNAVRNTLMLNFLDLVMGFPAPVILAILLNELRSRRFKRVTQTIAYMPHFLSWVIIYGLAARLFAPQDGLINILIRKMGGEAIPFLNENTHWVFTYVFVGIWQTVGWSTIIYLAAITNINPELYEAARVDGAKRRHEIWHITLPCLKPTIVVLLILALGGMLGSNFDRPYIFGNYSVNDVSEVLSTYVYTQGIRAYQYSYTTAVGLFQSVVNVIFLVAANIGARKIGERGLW